MKKLLFLLVLGVGLIAFSACTTNNSNQEIPIGENSNSSINTSTDDEPVTVLKDGSYVVDVNASQMTWHASRIVGNNHRGLIQIKNGNLDVSEGNIIGGNFIIDMNTISSDEDLDNLVTHLKSEDFFDVSNYSEAFLEINNVTYVDGAYQITADLGIKGTVSSITFPAQITNDADRLLATAAFSIDRTVWDIRYGSNKFFEDLGDKTIKDEIDFTIQLEAQRQ
jgi:polyisoprenoid-binding protein YceI